MTSNESPSKKEILDEIADVKSKLKATDEYSYRLAMDKKFLKHRLADLLYDLKSKG